MKINRHSLPLVLVAALAVVLVAGALAQQAIPDKAVDPVCGMTVVKANAKATFDYKGATYYFCSTGCKDAFAKEPEKYLKAQAAKAGEPKAPAMPGHMGMMHGQAGAAAPAAKTAEGMPMNGCQGQCCGMMGEGQMMPGAMPMVGRMGRMPMRHGRMGMPMSMGMGMGRVLALYGDKVEVVVENTKDGAALKVTSKDPEVAKAIQVHMAEHVAMMKKAKETAAKAPAADPCAECPMKK
jgi:YHS domain-containing protein